MLKRNIGDIVRLNPTSRFIPLNTFSKMNPVGTDGVITAKKDGGYSKTETYDVYWDTGRDNNAYSEEDLIDA